MNGSNLLAGDPRKPLLGKLGREGVKKRLTAEQVPAMGRWGFGLTSSRPGGEEAGLHPPTPIHRPSLARIASRSAPDLTCMAKRKQLGGEGQSPQREILAPLPLEMHPQSEEQGTASWVCTASI